MGKEAICHIQWASESAQCKVLLETHDLIVRSPIRRTVPIASLTHVEVRGDQLHFHAGADKVTITLGATQAQSWTKKIATPPPTLAAKLGITSTTQLALIGEFATEELKQAIAEAATTESKSPSLILATIKSTADLNYTLDLYSSHPGNPPIWLIYPKGSMPKGSKQPLPESEIRSTLRREGFIDTKVSSVSATLTALKFIKRT